MKSSGKKLVTRRQFLKRGGAALLAAGAAPYVVTSTALGAPSGRIVMGGIGVGGRGSGVLGGFLSFGQVRVVAVCDVDRNHRDRMKASVDQRYGNKDCAAYTDFRELLARNDIDAVMVATPDHWHGIITIEACKSGKDVFCEKPLSLTIGEGRAMANAARRYGRVFSCGSQRVLGDYKRLHERVRGGYVGQVKEVFVNVGGPSGPCHLPGQPVPSHLDWDMWLGPAPWRPYNKQLHPFSWRGFRDYSGGQMTDWGAHKFASAVFAMGLEKTGPVEIYPPDGRDHKYLTYVFASGAKMYHSQGVGDITVKGTEGEATRESPPPSKPVRMPEYKGNGGIGGDFLHCVKSREQPFRDVEIAHRAATVCHLGNIAYWLKRPLKWDPEKEKFVGDPQANRWIDRPKRAPWHL